MPRFKYLGDLFEHSIPEPEYPLAEVIWSSSDHVHDAKIANELTRAAKSQKPTSVPGRVGFWIITAIYTEQDGELLVMKGMPISAEEMLRRASSEQADS